MVSHPREGHSLPLGLLLFPVSLLDNCFSLCKFLPHGVPTFGQDLTEYAFTSAMADTMAFRAVSKSSSHHLMPLGHCTNIELYFCLAED